MTLQFLWHVPSGEQEYIRRLPSTGQRRNIGAASVLQGIPVTLQSQRVPSWARAVARIARVHEYLREMMLSVFHLPVSLLAHAQFVLSLFDFTPIQPASDRSIRLGSCPDYQQNAAEGDDRPWFRRFTHQLPFSYKKDPIGYWKHEGIVLRGMYADQVSLTPLKLPMKDTTACGRMATPHRNLPQPFSWAACSFCIGELTHGMRRGIGPKLPLCRL